MNEKILSILNEIRPEAEFEKSSNFVEDGLLDSFDLIMLVTEIDKKFSISIPGTEIVPENFTSLLSIQNLLEQLGVNNES